MRELDVPIGLLFVDHDFEHMSHRVIDVLDAAIGARVVGAGSVDLVDPEALADGAGI